MQNDKSMERCKNNVPMGGLLIDTFAHNFFKKLEYKRQILHVL